VVLDVRTPTQVADAVATLLAIESASGVMVQKQVSGLELILGVSREGAFGHLVLFGLGGIFTEALRDVVTALAPIGSVEAARMLGSIRGQRLLDGWRGLPAIDREAVGRALCALGALVHRFPEIAELDVNPLCVRGSELWAVDGRIALGEATTSPGA
jgi:acetyltransferase